MFNTVTGSLIILFSILAIIAALALFLTALLGWMFLTEEEAAETTTVYEPSPDYPLRKAANCFARRSLGTESSQTGAK